MESEFVPWLRNRVPSHPRLDLGIGDDAAVLSLPSQHCVVTSDMLMDGVDFVLSECDPRRVGRKALAVNLSDLAAMAAEPVAAIVSIAVPNDAAVDLPKAIYEGLLELAAEFGVALAGGDTNIWRHPLAISVTAIGEPTAGGVLKRSGARAGDAILATGEFGGSILGRHFDFTPRVREALTLHERYNLHAAMDVSDGLSLDLSRLAGESGCGAVIDGSAVPISDDARRLAEERPDAGSPLDHALSDGEDFELILAVDSASASQVLADQSIGVPVTKIGEFVVPQGLWIRSDKGDRQPLTPRGYEH
ncbi:MAG: thiamine-monophosphate kinase [Planctomycetes bacterium]|nr:thiamine-monophosphate kinase [Planctomycetota bacterium]